MGNLFGRDGLGKWIAFDDPKIDDYIDNILNEIVSKTVNKFYPETIILDGSFAQGEGTVIKKNDHIEILSDFDMCFVKNGLISKKDVKKFTDELSSNYNIKLGIYRNKTKKYINPSKRNPVWRINPPSVVIYTRKYGGKVLYGEDYLSKIPNISPDKIPLWEGLRLLFNRAGESLKYISYDSFQGKKLSNEEIYWAVKVVIACMDAFLIVNHKYHYSYKEKLNRFGKIFSGEMDLKSSQEEKFREMINDAISFKLYGNKEFLSNNRDNERVWSDIKEMIDIMFRYLVKNQFDFEFNNYLEFKNKYLSHPSNKNWYRGPILSPLIQNIYYSMILTKKGYKFSLKRIYSYHIVVPHIMYAGIILIFLSVSDKGKVNSDYLNGTKEILSFFGKTVSHDNPYVEWENIRKEMINLWEILHL